jgi:hypothetical protein
LNQIGPVLNPAVDEGGYEIHPELATMVVGLRKGTFFALVRGFADDMNRMAYSQAMGSTTSM